MSAPKTKCAAHFYLSCALLSCIAFYLWAGELQAVEAETLKVGDTIDTLPTSFIDDAGKPFRLTDLRGRRAILAMDHTQSLEICSDTIRRMRAVHTAAARLGKQFDFIVLSLDPQADTPESWRRYKQYFGLQGENWHFLNASPSDTDQLVERLGIQLSFDQGYRFHAVKLLRVDAEGRIVRQLVGYDRDTEAFLR